MLNQKLESNNKANTIYTLAGMLEMFLAYITAKNYSKETVRVKRNDLGRFVKWCEERAINVASQVDEEILERYLSYLSSYQTKLGKSLDSQTQSRMYTGLRTLFRWMAKSKYLPHNLMADIEGPKMERRLPNRLITMQEAEQVLRQPNLSTLKGIRDRAILETLYSTGIRRMEIASLKLIDVNKQAGMLAVIRGKGRKDRVIPIGERALAWIEKYLIEARPKLLTEQEDNGYLFINQYGVGFSVDGLGHTVKEYFKKAGISTEGGCHIFRHTMATLMLEAGADVRYIQQMLGHEDLMTTQIYTHVNDRKLKEVHDRTHPSAKLKRKPTPPSQLLKQLQELEESGYEQTDL